ncbi:Kelch repeat-containing protein [Sinomicrobium sp.]
MKTHFLSSKYAALLCSIVLFVACDDSDTEDDNPQQQECISLFLRTEQDQMSDFAYNAMTVFDGIVWSFGGQNNYSGEAADTRLWNSTDGQNWRTVPTTGLDAIAGLGHTLTTFNDKMLLIGGKDNSGNPSSEVWATTNGTDWLLQTEDPPFGAVANHAVVSVGDTDIYLIAQNASGTGTVVWHSNDGTTWTQLTDNAFGALKKYHALSLGDELYVIGGISEGAGRTNAVWKSSNGTQWQSIDVSGLPAIDGHSVAVYNDKAWVIGGSTDTESYTNDIYYSSNLQDWTLHHYSSGDTIDAMVGASSLSFHDEL